MNPRPKALTFGQRRNWKFATKAIYFARNTTKFTLQYANYEFLTCIMRIFIVVQCNEFVVFELVFGISDFQGVLACIWAIRARFSNVVN